MNKLENLKKLSDTQKRENVGGMLWTGAIAFSLIGSTITSFVQLIMGIVNTFSGNNNSSTNASSSTLKSSNYVNNNVYTRLSKYPSSSTINYQL